MPNPSSFDYQILRDSREKPGGGWFEGEAVVTCLQEGDYSIGGHDILIERKSANDFLGSLTFERERFNRELRRLSFHAKACIVVEGNLDAVLEARNISRNSILASVATFYAAYGVPCFFASNRQTGEDLARQLFEKFIRVSTEDLPPAEY